MVPLYTLYFCNPTEYYFTLSQCGTLATASFKSR